MVARPQGRNSTVRSSLSTYLSICSSGEQEQEKSGGSQAPGEEQYSGKLLFIILTYMYPLGVQSFGSQASGGSKSSLESCLSTQVSICTAGGQEQEQSGGSQAPGEEQYSGKLLALARKLRMNTEARRKIFCLVLSSEDYLEAAER